MQRSLAAAEALKISGNTSLKANDTATASRLYTEAISCIESSAGRAATNNDDLVDLIAVQRDELLATLFCNRALACIRLGSWKQAIADSKSAAALRPEWPKALWRLARALAGDGQFSAAVSASRRGEMLLESLSDHSRMFQPLLDMISHEAGEVQV